MSRASRSGGTRPPWSALQQQRLTSTPDQRTIPRSWPSIRNHSSRAECPLPVKASVHGEALRALAADETQSSAPETELAPAFGGGPLCAHTGYVRELANQITK